MLRVIRNHRRAAHGEAGGYEGLVDGVSEYVKSALSGPIEQMYPQLAK